VQGIVTKHFSTVVRYFATEQSDSTNDSTFRTTLQYFVTLSLY